MCLFTNTSFLHLIYPLSFSLSPFIAGILIPRTATKNLFLFFISCYSTHFSRRTFVSLGNAQQSRRKRRKIFNLDLVLLLFLIIVQLNFSSGTISPLAFSRSLVNEQFDNPKHYLIKLGFVDAKVETSDEEAPAMTLIVRFVIDELPNDDEECCEN